MKWTLTPIMLLTTLVLTAQVAPTLSLHEEHKDGYRAPALEMPTGGERGTAFFLETFDNDLNGWTVNTVQGVVDWKWTNTGPGPTSSTYPVPVLNTSTPSGWVIIDDDYDGVNGQATDSWLVSPVIDLSAAPANLKVEFDQYFQEFQLDQTFVGVSTDGGVTWNETEINIGVGRDGRPNPEAMDVDISAWVAANPSNVQLRFRYQSVWDYGWQVDNVAIRELPNNDMAIVRASNTSYDFDASGFDFMDYSLYPVSQLAGLAPRATVKNKGFDPQTGVTVNINVQGPGGTVVDQGTTPANYAPGEENEVVLPGFTPASEPGEYTITYSVDQDQEDELPLNNTQVSTVNVTTNVYGHDDGAVDNFQVQGPNQAGESFEVGNYYVLTQSAYVTAIQVAIHENTPVGATVYGAVYLPSSSNTEHPELLELTGSAEVTAEHLNPIGGSTFITLPFFSPFQVDAGEPILVVAGSFDGPDNVHFATSGISAPQVSNIHYPNLTTSFQFYITKTPMVRLVISDNVGITDLQDRGIVDMTLRPNPVQDLARLSYTLEQASIVRLTLTDLAGQLVHSADLGMRPAGEQRHDLNTGQLAAGTYLCTLTVGGERLTKRLVVTR